MVVSDFVVDLDFESQIFDNHYSYYSDLYEKYSYISTIFPLESEDEDDEDWKTLHNYGISEKLYITMAFVKKLYITMGSVKEIQKTLHNYGFC